MATRRSSKAELSEEQLARELLTRRAARRSLTQYSQAIVIPGRPVPETDETEFKPVETDVAVHHRLIMEAIERCIERPRGRLMILAPPGSAKSTYASVVAPTWAMGREPDTRVMMASYAAKPIIRHSKRCRQICASPEYQSIWGTQLRDGSKAADEFELGNGSSLYAAGLTGGLTSSRCDVGILDDPVSGRRDADSAVVRRVTLDAYQDDFMTRVKPRASIILIQTRWNQEDLAGSILPANYAQESGMIECRDGQTWEVLCIQAKCESKDDPVGRKIGEYLWPEWISMEDWKVFERVPRTWSALCQQRPAPEQGLHFRRENFMYYDRIPEERNVYMASDFALTEDGGDFTEHGVFATDASGRLYALDWWRDQVSSDRAIDAGLDLVERWRPNLWFGERGMIEKALGPSIASHMRDRRVFAGRHLLPTVGKKEARCSAFIGVVSSRSFYVPHTSWAEDLIDQLIAFPAGRFDDAVDVCGIMGRALDVVVAAEAEQAEVSQSPRMFTEAWFAERDHIDRMSAAERARYYN